MTKGTIVRPASNAIDLEQESDLKELLTMLTYRRPSNSKTECKFRNRWPVPLGCEQDEFGNLWKTVGDNSPILFCSHTDTVHRESGRGRVSYGDGVAMAEGSNCLGADDTVGVWLMMNMIRAN